MYDAEAIIARALEGKFYDINGVDVNEVARQIDEERAIAVANTRAAQEAAARRAAEAKRIRAFSEACRSNGLRTSASPRVILQAVAHAHNVKVEEMADLSRAHTIVPARMHACYLIRELTGISFPRVGVYVNRDHTTVLHAWRTWPERRSKYARQERMVREMLNVDLDQPHSAIPADSGVSAEPRLT